MRKYQDDAQVKALVGKNIKDGYVFSGTKGVVKSFSEKKETYSVTVKYINGETLDVEYKEDELILAELSVESTNKEIEETKALVEALTKKTKRATVIGCVAVLALLVAAILISIFVKKYNVMIITLSCILLVVLAIGITMLMAATKNEKKSLPLYRKIENVILLNKEEEIKNDKGNDIFKDIEKLKALLDSGAITAKDYEEAKKKILKKI